jgi:hypothetical protein
MQRTARRRTEISAVLQGLLHGLWMVCRNGQLEGLYDAAAVGAERSATKVIMNYFRVLFCLCLCATTGASSGSIDVGVYRYTGNPSGAVEHNVELEINKRGGGYILSLQLVWEPGVAIEIDCEANASDPSSSVLKAQFQDNFGNDCSGTFDFSEKEVKMDVHATKVVESRAARQYGTYILKRAPAKE